MPSQIPRALVVQPLAAAVQSEAGEEEAAAEVGK